MSITNLILSWNSVEEDQRWRLYNDRIENLPAASKKAKKAPLYDVFGAMYATVHFQLGDVKAVSPECHDAIDELKIKVHQHYDAYRYNRSLARKIWDIVALRTFKRVSVEYSYKKLIKELYKIGDIELERQPVISVASDPVAEPNVEPVLQRENEEVDDDSLFEGFSLLFSEEETTTQVEPLSPFFVAQQNALTISNHNESIDNEELPVCLSKSLINALKSEEKQEVTLHVATNQLKCQMHLWSPEILQLANDEVDFDYHLLIVQKNPEDGLFKESLAFERSLSSYQTHIHWHTGKKNKRIRPEQVARHFHEHVVDSQQKEQSQQVKLNSLSNSLQRLVRERASRGQPLHLILDSTAMPEEHCRVFDNLQQRLPNLRVTVY